MIKIKESDLQNSIILSNQEKCLGMAGNSNIEYRKFSLPKLFKGLDLSGENYVVNLQVNPINEEEPDYFIPLSKEILDNTVEYTWKVTRKCTKDFGDLKTNLVIKSVDEEEDIVYYSYLFKFIILENINAIEEIEQLDRNALEQYVIQCAAHAQNAHVEYEKAVKEHEAFDVLFSEIKKIKEFIGLKDDEIENP